MFLQTFLLYKSLSYFFFFVNLMSFRHFFPPSIFECKNFIKSNISDENLKVSFRTTKGVLKENTLQAIFQKKIVFSLKITNLKITNLFQWSFATFSSPQKDANKRPKCTLGRKKNYQLFHYCLAFFFSWNHLWFVRIYKHSFNTI